MRGARTRDGLLAQVPPWIVMSRPSGIARSDSCRADLPQMTMLMPAHLRGGKQGDGLTNGPSVPPGVGRRWCLPAYKRALSTPKNLACSPLLLR